VAPRLPYSSLWHCVGLLVDITWIFVDIADMQGLSPAAFYKYVSLRIAVISIVVPMAVFPVNYAEQLRDLSKRLQHLERQHFGRMRWGHLWYCHRDR
jgi:hypothetical protein